MSRQDEVNKRLHPNQPVAVPDENTPEGQEQARQIMYAAYRAAGNFGSIPYELLTDEDKAGYLNTITRDIKNFAPDDGISCIAPHDGAFLGLIDLYNKIASEIKVPLKTAADFEHAPFCK